MTQLKLKLIPALRQREFPTPEKLKLKEGTHCYIIYDILLDGLWHNVIDMMMVKDSMWLVTRNWAIRSRISDLNRKLKPLGYLIESRLGINRQGEYRLKRV